MKILPKIISSRVKPAGGNNGADYEGAKFGNKGNLRAVPPCRQEGKKDSLDEYAKLTGFHRKYATAKLNPCIKKREHIYNNCVIKTTKVELPKKRRRSYVPKYGADVISSLVKIWRTFDCMCGQRLVPFICENMDALADEPASESRRTSAPSSWRFQARR